MCIEWLAIKEDMISCPALKGSPGSDGNSFAGGVADSHHDLQPK